MILDFEALSFHTGLAKVWDLVGALNRFIVQQEPWKLARDPGAARALDTILYDVAEGLRIVAALVAPVMPASAQSLWRSVGAQGDVSAARLDEFHWGTLPPGAKTVRGAALFPRIDKAAWLAGAATSRKESRMDPRDPGPPVPPTPSATPAKPAAPSAAQPAAPAAAGLPAEITIDDFARVELRTAKVLAAERVAGADRLLKLTVDVGTATRTIVAGIAAAYAPETLVGKTIVVVANLKPARLRGILSQGMLLAASDASGRPVVLTTADPEVPAGWRVK
jgi:methionyl-tRNA synthetase